MKRCFGKALILALIASIVLTPVMAQASEVVGERVEAAVMWATDAGDTGLTVEDEPIVSGQTPVEAAVVYSSAEKGESPRELEFEITSAELSAPESATGIRISAETLSIGVEEQYTALTVVAEPEGSLISGVTWRSGNAETVMVDPATGAVTGLKKGSATIYATTAEGLEAECKVQVQSNPTAITVDPARMTISKGMTRTLTVSVSGGASGTITYASSKPAIAAVDENGSITALSVGTATIVAKTYNGKKAKCKIKVMNEVAALSFPEDTLSIAVGENASLTPTVLDADGNKTVAEVTYAIDPSSPDAQCIALDPRTGAITPQHTGKAVVTATTHNDIAASCNVVVANPPTDVTLHPDSVTIGIGEI